MLGSVQHRILNTVVGIPAKYQDAITCGARFFELQYPKQSQYSQSIFGFYDIILKKRDSIRLEFDETVLTNSTINFEIVSKEGTLVAFVPDDRYWHNRTMLCDSQGYRITQMHTVESVIPASHIKIEIDTLREFITEKVPMFKVVDENNIEVDVFLDRKKAERFLVRNKEKDLDIIEVTVPKKKKFIQEMIRQYKHAQYGWTSCIEFKENVIAPVKEIIKERMKKLVPDAAPAAIDPTQLLAALKQLDPEVLKVLLATTQQQQKQSEAAVTEQKQYTISGLTKKNLTELSKIATDLNIPCEGMTKAELAEEIMAVTQRSIAPAPELPVEEEIIVT